MFRRWINFCTDYTGAPLCQKYDQEVIKKKKKVESQSWPLANFKKKKTVENIFLYWYQISGSKHCLLKSKINP